MRALLLLFIALARAEDPPPAEPAGAPAPAGEPAPQQTPPATGTNKASPAQADAEVVIYDQMVVAKKKQALDKNLRQLGYRPGDDKGDRVVYRPETVWKPTVIVHDDGFMVMRRTRPRFEPWVKGKSPYRWLSCIPPFTLMCIKMSGWLVSESRLTPQKGRVAEAVDPELRAWREAVIARNFNRQIGVELPQSLDGLWLEGLPLEGDDPPIADPSLRRAALLRHWSSRACTPEGQEVREVIELYLALEVQRSPFPVTPEEEAAAEAAQACGDRLELDLPTPLDGGPPPP